MAGGSGDMILPGSHHCIGCGGLTFRQNNDQLCPRCAFESEQMIEQIELEALDHDLQRLTEFEAWCHEHRRPGLL